MEQSEPPASLRRPRDLVRAATAFTVMSGGPAILAALGATSASAAFRAVLHRQRPPTSALVGVAGLVAYGVAVRPWTRSWGATPDEVDGEMPGDDLVPVAGVTMTRAVTIDAPIDRVWPWLAQIGQDRAGFYSYTWLENLAGCHMRNADRIHPEWQERAVGDGVPLHPLNAPKLARFERNHSYAFEGGWYFSLRPIDAGRTRLLARTRVPRGFPSLAYAIFVEGPHFVMERKMLLGIKDRAERSLGSGPTMQGVR